MAIWPTISCATRQGSSISTSTCRKALPSPHIIWLDPFRKDECLYGKEIFSIDAIESHDILLMPSWEMQNLAQGFANLTFSSHVISDMKPQAREIYLDGPKFSGRISSAKKFGSLRGLI